MFTENLSILGCLHMQLLSTLKHTLTATVANLFQGPSSAQQCTLSPMTQGADQHKLHHAPSYSAIFKFLIAH